MWYYRNCSVVVGVISVKFSVPWTLPCQPRNKKNSRGIQVNIFVVHALWFAMIAQLNLFRGILWCVFATTSRICLHGNCTVRALRFSEFAGFVEFSVVQRIDRDLQPPLYSYGRSWPFLFCHYGTRAQVDLRTGSVVPLSGHDGMKK